MSHETALKSFGHRQERSTGVDRQFSLENIDTLIEEQPVIARLLVGTIGATAALMIVASNGRRLKLQ